MNGSRKPSHVSGKDSAETARDTNTTTTSGQIQPLKIPDAVAALAQAAAKANGETEKYLPGWPLFSPPKVQLDKCTKCSMEFCSAINFRRHSRVHRRTLKMDRDFPKNRDLLAAFWNKLTVDDASTILSLTGVVIEGVTGSSILTALSSWMCKPGYASLPMSYARAGSELLDLIQTKASMHLPVSSDELFSLLDEASEKTFLCTNTAACIHKFLFDGEVDKIATEMKNVVSCVSYMLEQKLVEAWCADKTAEALRCQKLLEEEEEASQKRQAELMERKRMKKLRQKEQRLKNVKDEDVTVQAPEIMDDATCSTAIQSVKSISDPDRSEQEESQYLQFPAPITSGSENGTLNLDLSVEDIGCDLGPEMDKGVVWCADKTAEALRCQKLLEEEEEAAQKRQAKLMERKWVKKCRQKEQRLKNVKDENVTVKSPEIMDDAACSTAIQSVKSISDPDRSEQEESQYLQFSAPITSESENGLNLDLSVEDISCDLGPQMDNGVVWCADKTVEALRCQKLLEEEEEAAQKRQAELMERKRVKKCRQKEQRLKNVKDEAVTVQSPEIMDDVTCSTAIQSVNSISDPDRSEQEESQHLQFSAPITSESENGLNLDLSVEDISCDLGPEMDKDVVLRQQVSRRHLTRTERLAENSVVPGPAVTSKHPAFVRPSNYKDPNVCSAPSRNKTCALKLQSEIEEQCQKHELDVDEHGMGPSKNSRVLIGSISVAIEDGSEHLQDFRSKNETVPPISKTVKQASVKVMQPVTHEGNRNEVIPHSDSDSTPAAENRSHSSITTDQISYSTYCSTDLVVDEHLQRTMFSIKEATAFLSQRWKEAIAADHVKLVVS